VASQGTGHDVNRQRQPVREIGGNLKWHEVIGDPTLANAILDRLVHNAYKLDLKGDSMRKRSRPSTRTENRDS
jgi:DNA replication protein DnaC